MTKPIPDFLQARAKKHGLRVRVLEPEERDEELDYGSFLLTDQDDVRVWEFGLPAEGIADALNCYEHELQLSSDNVGDAWRNFGSQWAARYASRKASSIL